MRIMWSKALPSYAAHGFLLKQKILGNTRLPRICVGGDKRDQTADLLNAIAFEVVRIVQNVPILYVLYGKTKLLNTISANRYTAFRSDCGQIVVRCPRADTLPKNQN